MSDTTQMEQIVASDVENGEMPYYAFLRRVANNELSHDDFDMYEERFNALVRAEDDKQYQSSDVVESAIDKDAFLSELKADKEKYKDSPLYLREPATSLIRVLSWHLDKRNYPLGKAGFELRTRKLDARLPKDPQPQVIVTDCFESHYIAPEWLADLYRDAKKRLINVDRHYELGAIVEHQGHTYRVVDNGSISPSEAAELEEGFDIFNAEGSYSRLELIQEG